VPVFVLTDQYFLDSFYNVEEMQPVNVERYIVKTDKTTGDTKSQKMVYHPEAYRDTVQA